MKRIGKYQNRICYELTKEEFFNGKCYENDRDIFILHEDGLMILNNRAFARYDGHSVDEFRDPYDFNSFYEFRPYDYYVPNKVKAQAEAQVCSTFGDFSEYSKCVDDFFANLKEVSV